MPVVNGMRFPIEVILVCIRWYAAYPLSSRHLEEMMEERGVTIDHSTVSRWAIRFLSLLEKIFRKYKRSVGGSWRMDETYIKESLIKLITFMVRQAHHERNQYIAVRLEPVEGLNQSFRNSFP